MMELIPAIDILEGRVVRLMQGRYEDVTVYAQDPVAMAKSFEATGAKRLHVVDLEGAKLGRPVNHVIQRIVKETALEVQVGGGLRTIESAESWFDMGVSRGVLGTIAVKDPSLAQHMCERWPHRIIIAIDARHGHVAVEGWLEDTQTQPLVLAKNAQDWGAAAVLYTDISRDGTSEGPNIPATCDMQNALTIDVIASGGIGSLSHVTALDKAGIRATVCGRALYSGAFSYGDAMQALRGDHAR